MRKFLNRGYPFNPDRPDSHPITIDVTAVTVPETPHPITTFINRAWQVLKDTADQVFRFPHFA